MTLRTAQRLWGLGPVVNTILVKLADVFTADRVADYLTALLPYEARAHASRVSHLHLAPCASGRSIYHLGV